jgi:uncharacterized membrane protein YphA (DoxX/SURF4 family)
MLLTKRLMFVVRILLASLFLFSGIAKLFSPQTASTFISDLLSLSSDNSFSLVLLLSLFELALGLSLLVGFKLNIISFLSSLFLLLTVVVGLYFFGEDKPCGCFGELISSKTDGFFLLRSLGFLFVSLILLKNSSPAISQSLRKKDE